MNYIINYLKVLIIPLGVLLLSPILLAIFNLLGVRTYSVVILIMMIITSLISGFLIGRKANKKGYINGIILGLAMSIIFFILSLFAKNDYSMSTLIFYLIIIVSTTIGSMAGIQKKIVD